MYLEKKFVNSVTPCITPSGLHLYRDGGVALQSHTMNDVIKVGAHMCDLCACMYDDVHVMQRCALIRICHEVRPSTVARDKNEQVHYWRVTTNDIL